MNPEDHNEPTDEQQERLRGEIAKHEGCGLSFCGYNAEGEPEYIGTKEQWELLDDDLE